MQLPLGLGHQHQLLAAVLRADRDHQAAALGELVEQGRGDRVGGGGDDDGVKRRLRRPALVAVAGPYAHLVKAQLPQRVRRALRQRRDDLDGEHLGAHRGEDRRLVARAGADLEDLLAGFHIHGLGHESDNERLGDGLPVTDGQRMVRVGLALHVGRHETMPRHRAQGREGGGVGDAAGDNLFFDHAINLRLLGRDGGRRGQQQPGKQA